MVSHIRHLRRPLAHATPELWAWFGAGLVVGVMGVLAARVLLGPVLPTGPSPGAIGAIVASTQRATPAAAPVHPTSTPRPPPTARPSPTPRPTRTPTVLPTLVPPGEVESHVTQAIATLAAALEWPGPVIGSPTQTEATDASN